MENSKLFDIAFRNDPKAVIDAIVKPVIQRRDGTESQKWLHGGVGILTATADVICTIDKIAAGLGVKRAHILNFGAHDAGVVLETPATIDGVIGLLNSRSRFRMFGSELSWLSNTLETTGLLPALYMSSGQAGNRLRLFTASRFGLDHLFAWVQEPKFLESIDVIRSSSEYALETFVSYISTARDALKDELQFHEVAFAHRETLPGEAA